MLESKQSQMQQFFQIQEQITPVVPVHWNHDRTHSNLLDINILTKFGADWSIFADDRV